MATKTKVLTSTKTQLLQHKKQWIQNNLTLSELLRRAKLWKHCN